MEFIIFEEALIIVLNLIYQYPKSTEEDSQKITAFI